MTKTHEKTHVGNRHDDSGNRAPVLHSPIMAFTLNGYTLIAPTVPELEQQVLAYLSTRQAVAA